MTVSPRVICRLYFIGDGSCPQYSYLGSTPLLIVFGVGVTTLKFKEGAYAVIPSELFLFLFFFFLTMEVASFRIGFVVLSQNEGAVDDLPPRGSGMSP